MLSPYTPSDERPWDLRRVVHLHRRAGFAATWQEIQRDLHDEPAAAIERLVHPPATDGSGTGPTSFEEPSNRAISSG